MYFRNQVSPKAFSGLVEGIFNQAFADDARPVFSGVPVNIQESDAAYELQVVAPGLKKEDFKLSVDRNVITVSYDLKKEATEVPAGPKTLRSEYKFNAFKRSFTLNEKVDTSNISAKYNDGILVVTLPKKEQEEPKAHEISVN